MTAAESMLEYAKAQLTDTMTVDDWRAFIGELARDAKRGNVAYDTLFDTAVWFRGRTEHGR